MSGWSGPALPSQWSGTAKLPFLVGRRAELAILEEAWAAVGHGERQVVLVAGEAGAGKSRLVREAAVALHGQGAAVLIGGCSADLGLPFDPLVEPVRELLEGLEAGLLRPAGRADAGSRPDPGLLRTLVEGSLQPSGTAARLALSAVVSALKVATRSVPVVLVLEDVHWAGESGLRALRFLVEQSGGLALLVLLTYRGSPPDRTDLLTQYLAGILRLDGVHSLELPALGTDDVAEYLEAVGAGDAAQARAAARALRDHTGGNPFMLGEVVRELRSRGGLGTLGSGPVPVPESLRALVAGRLAALDREQRRVLELAAIAGETFGVPLLVGALAGEVDPGRVHRALAAAVAVGLVERSGAGAGTLRFPHALARQAVLDQMELFDLASGHASVGLALEAGPDVDGTRTQRLAHHFAAAAGLGFEGRAAVYLEQAATAAQARLANSDAAELFEQASTFCTDPHQRDRLLLRAARCHHVAGHVTRAKAIDARVATEGVRPLRLWAAIGYESSCWRSGADWGDAARVLKDALATDPEQDVLLRVRAKGHLARALATSGRIEQAVVMSEEAISEARAEGDERTLQEVLATDVHTASGLTRPRERLASAHELARLSERLGTLGSMGATGAVWAQAAYTLGEPEDVRRGLDALSHMVRSTQQPYWSWTLQLHQTGLRIMHCDFDGAERSMREGRATVRSFEASTVTEHDDGPASLQAFVLRRETGGLEPVRALLASGLPVTNPWRPAVVALGTELGIESLALPALQEAVRHDLPALRPSSSWPAVLSFLGEAAAWLGERELCEALLAEAEPYEGCNLLGGEFLAPMGSIHRLIAVLRAALGRRGVEDHFAAALDMDEKMGSTLHVATTQAEWAAHLVRTHAPSARIEEHARPARQLADRHGLVRVRRVLGPVATGPRTTLPDGLTSREVEVLGLIGRGCSNRDIARELVISEHTAANHVRSILMKTQSSNRTAAAHYALRHGLLTAPPSDR